MIGINEFFDDYSTNQYSKIYQHDFVSLTWYYDWVKESDNYHKNKNTFYYTVLIKNIFDYYLWMLDLSIYILKEYVNYYDYPHISHFSFMKKEYFSNSNIFIDVKEYDIAEYLKNLFWSDNKDAFYYQKLLNYILKEYPSLNYNLIFARLLYPNFFFNIINNNIENSDNQIKEMLLRIHDYEKFILFVGKILLKNNKIKNNAVVALFE